MPEPIYILFSFALLLVKVVSWAMVIRALISWINIGEDNKFVKFLYGFTEPAVYPVRKLFYKMNWFTDTPIDMSFTVSFLFLFIVEMILEILMG